MAGFIGEFDCRLDDKGRFVLPSVVKKQLDPADHDQFVINRGFEGNLNLYPMKEWEKLMAKVNRRVNEFSEKGRRFLRQLRNGATPVSLDSSGRILIPPSLAGYAGLSKDLMVIGATDYIELWDKVKYEQEMKEGLADYSKLAEELLGNLKEGDDQ
ncbi:MAG: division/cell wall cluster transcriptional repressor MraZ [Bacteroidota bacterium]